MDRLFSCLVSKRLSAEGYFREGVLSNYLTERHLLPPPCRAEGYLSPAGVLSSYLTERFSGRLFFPP